MFDVAGFARQCVRVMNVASLPKRKDFEKIVKITGLGMLLVGLIGVVLSFIFSLI